MFMRFRGGGVGHLGTRYLASRLKEDNHELVDEQQDEATAIAGLYQDSNSFLNDEDIEENSGMHEEPSNEEVRESDDEDKGEEGGEEFESDKEQEVPGEMSDEQDTDHESDKALSDGDLLDEEGFAEL